jgi:type IV pilus assembly protein PilW
MGGAAMMTNRHIMTARRAARGFSLLELMVAMVLSLIVMLGLVTLMDSVGVINRVQDGMARLQENGRFAMQRIAEDIRAAAGQHCSNMSTASSRLGDGGVPVMFLDRARAPIAHFDVSATPYVFGPTGQTSVYLISPRFMLFGNECDAANCTPALNATGRGTHAGITATMGTATGNRARGADVLSMRYLIGGGTRITTHAKTRPGDGAIEFTTDMNALGITSGTAGIWVTDCSVNEIINVTRTSATLGTAASNFSAVASDTMNRLNTRGDARAFNLARDLVTVSYFLQLKTDPNDGARMISSLMRRQRDATQELVEGVERLDFLYGVDDRLGRTSYLTAAQVDGLSAACPPAPAVPLGFSPTTFENPTAATPVYEPGCGWRAVKSIEVFMLLNTVNDVTVGNDEEFRYAFLNNGSANTAGTYENPSALGTLRNGQAPGRMLRREFRTLISLRGYNP